MDDSRKCQKPIFLKSLRHALGPTVSLGVHPKMGPNAWATNLHAQCAHTCIRTQAAHCVRMDVLCATQVGGHPGARPLGPPWPASFWDRRRRVMMADLACGVSPGVRRVTRGAVRADLMCLFFKKSSPFYYVQRQNPPGKWPKKCPHFPQKQVDFWGKEISGRIGPFPIHPNGQKCAFRRFISTPFDERTCPET